MGAASFLEVVVFRELAGLYKFQPARLAVIHNFFTGRRSHCQLIVAAVIPVMTGITSLAIPIIVSFVIFILMDAAAFFNDLITDRTLLIMLLSSMIPAIIQHVTLGGAFLFHGHAANGTMHRLCARFRAGGRVASFHQFPSVFLFQCADCTYMVCMILGLLHIPGMLLGVANGSAAILTEADMGTILQVHPSLICMGTSFHQAAAMAHIPNASVLQSHLFHPVVDADAAVAGCDAITHGITVTGCASAHIPAVGQGITQSQNIAILQIIRRHRLSGEIVTAEREQPAGSLAVIMLTDGAVAAAALIQTVAVNAAPQGCKTCSFSKIVINGLQDLLLIGAILIPTASIQHVGIDTAAGLETLQIEAVVQGPGILAAGPAKGIFCLTKGFSGIISPNRLGYHIGDRFICQDIVRNRAVYTHSQYRQVNINGCGTGFLSSLIALSV